MVVRQIPWPGPKPYTEDMADIFLGRDADLGRILDMLQGEHLALMTASSGAGKTSLIQAGLIPDLRRMRMQERVYDPDVLPLAPFPLLLNQWLGRAGKSRGVDYAQLVALEMHRYLSQSTSWFERVLEGPGSSDEARAAEAEFLGVRTTLSRIADYAVATGFATYEEDGPELVWTDPAGALDTDDQRGITTRLCEVLDIAADAFGEVLLILDQFEEVLLDWRLGEQAIAAVESVFMLRPHTVRQFISMRHDGLHLVDSLETKGLLESKRRMRIEPLSPSQTEEVVLEVSRREGHAWSTERAIEDSTVLQALIRAFADTQGGTGTRVGQVNLIGLQVVLNGMFRHHLGPNAQVDSETLLAYCESLSSSQGRDKTLPDVSSWLSSGRLQTEAPRQWLLACLHGNINGEAPETASPDVYEPQVLPMAANMAWLLVTPAGNKRTMTGAELHEKAWQEELEDIDADDLSGLAREQHWTLERLGRVLRATCDEALGRLVRGNVLKMRGSGTSGETAYELVHDQFGKPMLAWADGFESTAEFDLSSLRAIQSRPFKWSGPLRPHDDDGVIPYAVWRDCTLKRIDLSEMTFQYCDFSDTVFTKCSFKKVRFEHCVLQGSQFKASLSFSDVEFVDCDLGSTVFEGGAPLEELSVIGGHGLDLAIFHGLQLSSCQFEATSGALDETGEPELLDMRYIRFKDCQFRGMNHFHHCNLDGAALSGSPDPMRIEGRLEFLFCEMTGIELSNIDVSGNALHFIDSNCRGALFDRIDAGKDEAGEPADVDFTRVTLVGAQALGCMFEDVTFSGPPNRRPDASTFVIADKPRTARSPRVPSVLARLRFENLDAENMSIERCKIIDDITFSNCMLSGATFLGNHQTRRLEGDMVFVDDCDLSAAEFRDLHFTSVHQLRLEDCRGQGAFFREVHFEGDPASDPAGVFCETDLSGAVFLGCDMRHCRFSGIEGDHAEMQTLVIRPIKEKKTKEIKTPARVAHLVFDRVDMPGFQMRDVEILDDITFSNCDLGAGAIGRKNPDQRGRLHAHGDLIFDDCDMTAIEFKGIQFTDESLRIRNSNCTSAMFWEVGFELQSEREVGLLVESSSLRCSLMRDCEITRAVFAGKSPSSLSDAVAMLFIETKGDRAVLGDVAFTNYNMDGSSFEGVSLVGPVRITDCSLLRTKYTDLLAEGGGYLDLSESDLLYAQVDEVLLLDPLGLRLTDEQRHAARSQREHETALRVQAGKAKS